jgi:two-component system nitrogen regulation response regulator GlnG/two-component system response regulator HydG
MGLVVLWADEEPEYVGAWLPVGSENGSGPRVFGRGPARADDQHPRLSLLRQRPIQNELLPPMSSAALSRAQLELRAAGPGVLEVVNVGRRPLFVNGARTDRQEIRPGDILEIGNKLALMGALRPSQLDALAPVTNFAFGEADERGWVGESAAAWQLRSEITFAARRTGHVLILGETGTGKELVATAIHAASGRSGPLVSRNAATIPESLVDAELFGNPKGYPNPGIPERDGLVGAAHRGSLFLDEFADLPAGAQAHILRVLDSGEYQRLGESNVRKSEFRLIAATNRPESALRRDILARFDFRILVPNHSARREDVPLLLRHLFAVATLDDPDLRDRYCLPSGTPRLGAGFIRHLVQYPFSANVRELRQLLWRSLGDSKGDALTWSESGEAPGAEDSGDDLPRAEIQSALEANNGSLEKTWRALGLANRYVLRRLITKYGLAVTRRGG